MKHERDQRSDTSETCLACGTEYDNRSGGTCGQVYCKASDQDERFCLCENCIQEAMDETVVHPAALQADVVGDANWERLRAWAVAQHPPELKNQRFVWLIGAIAETYPDVAKAQEDAGSCLVLWDRQEKQRVVTVARGYSNLICLESVPGWKPFTDLADGLNITPAGVLSSENIPDTEPEFNVKASL